MLVDFPFSLDGETLPVSDRTRQGLSVEIVLSSQFFNIKYLPTVKKAVAPDKERYNRTQLHT